MKQIHYNIDKIKSFNANINLIYGEKSAGKSYQAKTKLLLKNYIETGNRFILLRRWNEDISMLWIEQYFSDIDIETLTNKKYNCISCYRKVLYFSIIDENKKINRIEKIGYVASLSSEQHLSSGSFLDVDTIVFEEFMARGTYIKDEPKKLMFFYSTIDRKRGTTRLWLLGNTISRVCPYLKEWNLDEVIRKQKQGTIELININNEENTLKIAIEYCSPSRWKSNNNRK